MELLDEAVRTAMDRAQSMLRAGGNHPAAAAEARAGMRLVEVTHRDFGGAWGAVAMVGSASAPRTLHDAGFEGVVAQDLMVTVDVEVVFEAVEDM